MHITSTRHSAALHAGLLSCRAFGTELCFCTLNDRAFDRYLMSVDGKRRIAVSSQLKLKTENRLHKAAFLNLQGREIKLPEKFEPLKSSLEYHFERFSKEATSS